jgi:hypothetical protein
VRLVFFTVLSLLLFIDARYRYLESTRALSVLSRRYSGWRPCRACCGQTGDFFTQRRLVKTTNCCISSMGVMPLIVAVAGAATGEPAIAPLLALPQRRTHHAIGEIVYAERDVFKRRSSSTKAQIPTC